MSPELLNQACSTNPHNTNAIKCLMAPGFQHLNEEKALLCRWIIRMSQSSPHPHIFLHLLISSLEFITLILFVFPLLILFLFKSSFLYQLVVCGTVFLNMWSPCHLHVPLRPLSFGSCPLSFVNIFIFILTTSYSCSCFKVIHYCVLIKFLFPGQSSLY